MGEKEKGANLPEIHRTLIAMKGLKVL